MSYMLSTSEFMSNLFDSWFKYVEAVILTSVLGTLAHLPRENSNRFIDGTLDTTFLFSFVLLLIYISISINDSLVDLEKYIEKKIKSKKLARGISVVITMSAGIFFYNLVWAIIIFISQNDVG